ncbi:MAG TPA: hypothetical protein VFD43_08410 [Planctomycetota bacterium]|nr:hypothetical protein [Planctomycetota bacterium]
MRAGAISILVDPLDADTILLIRFTEGLFRSTDGGATFLPFGAGLSPMVRELYHVPGEAHGVYALDGLQIKRSSDFGATWSPLTLAATEELKGLALPATGSTVLAFDAFNVHRSADGGQSWAVTASLVPFAGEIFDSLAISADGSVAYAGTFNGVWSSGDGGASFAPAGGNFSEWIQALTVSPSDPDTVFAGTPFLGLQRSTDGGASFAPLVSPLTAGNAEWFFWDQGGGLWYATLDSLAQSPDGGDTWVSGMGGWPSNTPIPAGMAQAAAGEYYLGCEGGGLNDQTGGGLYRMPAGAPSSWEHIGFLVAKIHDAEIAGAGGTRVIGLGGGVYAGAPGETIVPTAWHFDIGTDTRTVAIDPADPDRWVTGGVGAFFDNAQIVVVTDGGQSFVKVYEVFGAGVVQDIAFDPSNPLRVVAGMFPAGFGNEALTRSTNGGASWVDVPGTAGWATKAVAWDPHTPGRVMQLSDNSQWSQSLDGGQTWMPLQPTWGATGPAVLLAFDPFQAGVLYRGETGGGLWRSDNNGASWMPLGVSLQADSDLELHSQQPGLLWVSDAGGRVLISGNRGNSFEIALDVPMGSDGAALALDTLDGALIVGTAEASTWELPDASPVVFLGGSTAGTGGVVPKCTLSGGLPQLGNAGFGLRAEGFVGGALVRLAIGLVDAPINKFGGTFHVGGTTLWLTYAAGGTPGAAGAGNFTAPLPLPVNPILLNLPLVMQMATKDPGAPHPSQVVLGNALSVTLLAP